MKYDKWRFYHQQNLRKATGPFRDCHCPKCDDDGDELPFDDDDFIGEDYENPDKQEV